MADLTHEEHREPGSWLRTEIEGVMNGWRNEHADEGYWRSPLVSIASAQDSLFGRLREVVAEDHAMPQDILAGAQSVVVFFLPFHRRLGQENNRSGFHAARTWAEAYTATNRLIASINDHLRDLFRSVGFDAAVTPATHNFDEQRLVSRWSHKHLAYIAGLGTFGHNRLLITPAGCCGRLGSLVTTMSLQATQRPRQEWCLMKAGYQCSDCVSKCVYGALFETDFDRHACYRQCLLNNDHYPDLPLVDVCGKCACEVACSYKIPSRTRRGGEEEQGAGA